MRRILPDSYEIDVALQLTMEDDFSYFCKWDDLAHLLVKPNYSNHPAIADSCYIPLEEVFDKQEKF